MNQLRLPEFRALSCDAAGASDSGCVRKNNEDAFGVDANNRIFILADGIGGRKGGSVAANTVIVMLPQILKEHLAYLSGELKGQRSLDTLSKSISEVSRIIYERGKNDVELAGMGSTAMVAHLVDNVLNIAHMGDSRAYLLRDGSLKQLTQDHSVLNILMRRGEISNSLAIDHPARGRLTRFAGMVDDVDPETRSVGLEDGDIVCLCTDGLWDMVPDSRIEKLLSDGGNAAALCQRLIDAGIEAGGIDNLTAIVLRLKALTNEV
jgi:serine/threonine protein phosphatase PrpC